MTALTLLGFIILVENRESQTQTDQLILDIPQLSQWALTSGIFSAISVSQTAYLHTIQMPLNI